MSALDDRLIAERFSGAVRCKNSLKPHNPTEPDDPWGRLRELQEAIRVADLTTDTDWCVEVGEAATHQSVTPGRTA